MAEPETLYGKTIDELQATSAALGLPRYAAGQIARWLYKRHIDAPGRMSDLALRHRALLGERFATALREPLAASVSADGTRKYLYATRGGHAVEAAWIPDGERSTLCVSSQAGCRMGCAFCATGRMGLKASLGASEILNQIASLPERDRLTNLVFMGMGEPLDNADEVLRALSVITEPWGYGWSPTRVTLSTAGVLPRLEQFLARTRVHLAVSLHNPFPDERAALMPVERAWPIAGVVDLLRRHDFAHQRRVSFEYIVLSGMNDSPRHVRGLLRLLGGLPCRINLIRFHRIPGSPYFSPPDDEMVRLRDTLTARGLHTTIRASRGEDIRAACGLLSTDFCGDRAE